MNERSRTTNSIINVSISIASKIAIMVMSFVGRKVFIDVLGEELLGVNSLFTNILYVLSLTELGFGTAMSYSFYKPIAENDKRKISALISFYRRVYTIVACAIAVIGVCLIPFLEMIVKKDIPNLRLYYVLFLINSVVSYLWVYKTSLMNADQKNYVVNGFYTLVTFIRVASQIAVVVITKNFILYLVVMILSTFLNNVFVSYKADKMYPFIKGDEVLSRKEKEKIFLNVRSVFVYDVANIILDCTDSILITSILGIAIVGKYSNYKTVVDNVLTFVTIIFTSITASVGNLTVSESKEKRYKVYKVMNLAGYAISGMCITCFFVLMDGFVTLWIGKKFVLDRFVLIAFLVSVYVFCTFRSTLAYREAIGMYAKVKNIVVVSAVLNIVLSIILGKWIGLAGILLATSLSRLLTTFWKEPIILHRDYFGESAKKYFLSQLKNLACVIACVVVASGIVKVTGLGNSWFTLVVKAIICAIVVGSIYYAVYSKTEAFNYLWDKVKGKIKK